MKRLVFAVMLVILGLGTVPQVLHASVPEWYAAVNGHGGLPASWSIPTYARVGVPKWYLPPNWRELRLAYIEMVGEDKFYRRVGGAQRYSGDTGGYDSGEGEDPGVTHMAGVTVTVKDREPRGRTEHADGRGRPDNPGADRGSRGHGRGGRK